MHLSWPAERRSSVGCLHSAGCHVSSLPPDRADFLDSCSPVISFSGSYSDYSSPEAAFVRLPAVVGAAPIVWPREGASNRSRCSDSSAKSESPYRGLLNRIYSGFAAIRWRQHASAWDWTPRLAAEAQTGCSVRGASQGRSFL